MGTSVCELREQPDHLETAPFGRIIALAYEDGPTFGLAACAGSEQAYRFGLLAADIDGRYDRRAWDRGEELRLFGLAPLGPGTFERLVGLLSAYDQPRWPVWMILPTARGGALRQAVEQQVLPALEAAGPATLIAVGAKLSTPFREVRPMPPSADIESRARDWFAVLHGDLSG